MKLKTASSSSIALSFIQSILCLADLALLTSVLVLSAYTRGPWTNVVLDDRAAQALSLADSQKQLLRRV